MNLVERHIINKNHKHYKECDELCFLSKNLYNATLYSIKQHYFNEKEYLNYVDNYHIIKHSVDYKRLPAKVSNQIIRLVDKNFRSFFNLLRKKSSGKYKKEVRIPQYKKKDGRGITIYEKGALSKRVFDKEKKVKLSKTNIEIPTGISDFSIIRQARIVPKGNHYVIEIVYDKQENELKKDNNRYCSIDFGVDNLMTVGYNIKGIKPMIINGKPLKSINQYYNKIKTEIQSKLEICNKKKWSNRLDKLTYKRNNKINDYLHKSSRYLVNHLVSNKINTLIIGYNKEWKQDINIGKRNNQNFVQIPYYKLLNILKYKCKLVGIDVITQEESYTSKCSFLDNEEIKKHDKYLGKRIKRGLFKSNNGKLFNADLNGALNILKKAVPKAFVDGIEGLAVNPILINV